MVTLISKAIKWILISEAPPRPLPPALLPEVLAHAELLLAG